MELKSTLLALGLAVAAAVPLTMTMRSLNAARVDDDRATPSHESTQAGSVALTVEQQNTVKNILSKYDAASLTAEDAKAIHEAFRKAGLRGGPATGDAIKAAGFDPDRLRDLAPPPDRNKGKDRRPPDSEGDQPRNDDQQRSDGSQKPAGQEKRGQGRYSLEQAVSDRAQLSTIAFDGLAFLTGDFAGDTFLPPGKVSDYFGFQYMRDIDANGGGAQHLVSDPYSQQHAGHT